MAYWNCKQCVHTVRGRECQYIKINGPNCMLSWEYFWPEDGSDLCLAEQELILLPCYLCQHKCAAHLTSVHRERAWVQGQLGPQVLVWSPLEARGSCAYEVLHLLKQAFCRNSIWSLRLPWQHSPDGREERARELGSGPFWIKATIADELSLPPKSSSFYYIFQLEESDRVFALAFCLGCVNSREWGKCW